ncbi:MAG: 4-alpha-glucanotransferase, partial [Deltaproteobacteria bacterium]|nr:4-alpha-glucanotransferase [Deltaproteobacteria bacterium]
MALPPGLESLAALYGVEVRYHDVAGALHEASEDALRELLICLGAPLGAATLEAAARHRRVELARRALTRVVVAWQPEPVAVIALREATARGKVRVSVVTEAGEPRELTFDPAGLERVRRTDVEGESSVEVAVPLPEWIGAGYHRLHVEAPGHAVDLPLWVAPARAPRPPPRGLGLFAPLAAVRSARSDGIGDFRDLEAFGALVAAHGGDTVATLPLLPTFLDGPFDPSPYSPVSRLFWNELHLAVDLLPELARSAEARTLLADPAYRATAGELRAGRHVDPLGVLTHKRRILSLLADAACRDPASRERFEAELRARPDVADYARFRSRVEQERRPFRAWSERSSAEAAEGAVFRYHAYCQLRAETQLGGAAASLRARGVGLYLDLPLGAHPDGYDAYRHGAELLDGAEAGAPPDALFEGGQGWGFAPLHSERSSQAEHRYFRASVRHAVRHAARLRVDHVMGLHRIYTIPRGFGAKEGIYVRMPAEELWAALLIEASLRGTSLVGEDLGTVPDEVRARMARHGVSRLFVSEFEAPPESGAPLAVPEGAVASPNTHDMPTFAGWLRGRDLELRTELGLLHGEALRDAHSARREERHRLEAWLEKRGQLETPASDGAVLGGVLSELARSSASLVVVGLDDLVGETEPQNVPGTGPERPNFRRKIGASLEELAASPEFHGLLGRLTRGDEAPPSPRTPRSRPAERLTDLDLYLLSEGTHRALHDRLGAHPGELDGVAGTYFAVWAPDAARVSVVGDFVGWRPDEAPLFA